MYVYSGKCRLCDVGTETGLIDEAGAELRTGDIVMTYTVDDIAGCSNLGGLTVVVSDQFQSYTDGRHEEKNGAPVFFVMGIKGVDLNAPGEWRVKKLKGAEHVIDGEAWPNFGFSYADT